MNINMLHITALNGNVDESKIKLFRVLNFL